jgi:hypothetical protein
MNFKSIFPILLSILGLIILLLTHIKILTNSLTKNQHLILILIIIVKYFLILLSISWIYKSKEGENYPNYPNYPNYDKYKSYPPVVAGTVYANSPNNPKPGIDPNYPETQAGLGWIL